MHEQSNSGVSARPGRWRHGLLVLAVALVGSTATLVAIEWNMSGSPPVALRSPVSIHNALNGLALDNCDFSGSQHEVKYARLIFVITDLVPQARSVTANVFLCVPYWRLLALTHVSRDRSGKPQEEKLVVGVASEPIGAHVRPKYRNVEMGIVSSERLPTAQVVAGPSTLRTSIAELLYHRNADDGIGSPIGLGTMVFPLSATPSRYPFDWYAAEQNLELELLGEDYNFVSPPSPRPHSSDGQFTAEVNGIPVGGSELPFTIEVMLQSNLRSFQVAASVEDVYQLLGASGRGHGQLLLLQLGRTSAATWYVIIVALIPLVFALLLFVLFVNTREPSRHLGPEAIAGVAAVLLAILPIRLVLVPSEVSDLTVLDYWLGFEMSLLAAVACVAVWRALGACTQPLRAEN